jgi:polyhydroxybutyrate depolymerase
VKHLFAIIIMMCAFSLPALACGSDTDCMVGERHYRIAMPEGHDGETLVPALIFAHGFRGTARGVMRNGSLRRLASDLGAALIAVKSDGPGWDLPNGPRTLDSDGSREFRYFDAVIADAAKRLPIDTDRLVATGFSAGGMMVWNLACARPDRFAGFIPIAGTFWLEPPAQCAKPVASIVHIHGNADRTVPLMGRVIGPTKQGEVSASLTMYERFGGFGPAFDAEYDGLRCKEQSNPTGEVLAFCLFSGGHSFRTQDVRHGWEQLRQAGQL